MPHIFVNTLRNGLENMYQIVSLVYRKYICGMLEGWRTLTILHTLVLLGFFFFFLRISSYPCSNFIMEKYTYVLKDSENEWPRKIAVLAPNCHMNISLDYLEENWVLANNHHSLIQNKVC